MAVPEIVFVDEPGAVEFLLAGHRQRTRISDAIDSGQPARLETIIHAENVKFERDAWRVIAAEEIGQVDHPRRLGDVQRVHDIVELADIASHDADLLAVFGEIRGLRINVHASDLLAAIGEQRCQAAAEKTGPADDQDQNFCSSSGPIRIASLSSCSSATWQGSAHVRKPKAAHPGFLRPLRIALRL